MARGAAAGFVAVLVGALAVVSSADVSSTCTKEDLQECESMCDSSGLVVLQISCQENLYDCRCGSAELLEDGNIDSDAIFDGLEAEGASIQAEIAAVFDIALDIGTDMFEYGYSTDDQLLRGNSDFVDDGALDFDGAIEDVFMTEAEEMIEETLSTPEQGGFAILSFVPVDEQGDFGISDDNMLIALPSVQLACMASFISDFLMQVLQPDGDFMFRDDDDTVESRSARDSNRWSVDGNDYYYYYDENVIYPEEETMANEIWDYGQIFVFPDYSDPLINFTFMDSLDIEAEMINETTIADIDVDINVVGIEDVYPDADDRNVDQDSHQNSEKETPTWLVAVAAASVAGAVLLSVVCLLALMGFFEKPRRKRCVAVMVANDRCSDESATLLKSSNIQVVPTSTKYGPEMVTSSVMVV